MATDPNTLVELSAVGKTYDGGVAALSGLDFRVRRGEFACFVGPSGCGKSTALRIIAGLAKPTTGEVRWAAGEDAASDIGFVFQDPTLLPWSRVWQNVFLPLRLRGVSRNAARERVDEAIELVGLADFRKAYPRQLSGGMKMRVAIARALVTQPKLLLMDEPFAALDEITRFRLNDDLLRLWSEQKWTVLFVTHSVYESVFLAERVLVMGDRPGRVIDEVKIDGTYPREEAFRRTSVYGDACGRVSASLHKAVSAAEDAQRVTHLR